MMDRREFLRSAVVAGIAVGVTCMTGCGVPEEEAMGTASPSPPEPGAAGRRPLLAYFSRAGENYYYGDRIDLEIGNTRVVADMIAAAISVDVYEIEAADPYPENYEQTVQRNVREQEQDARPQIAGSLPDLAPYDTVLIGCPVWNVRAPMIVCTFIEGVDLAGRTVHPFVTYAVSGMGRVRDDYARLLPDSTVSQGLAVQGEQAAQARGDVEAWLRQLGLLTR